MNLGDPVTAHARRDAVALREGATIRESLQSLRGAVLPEKIVYFYVEDGAGRLVGVVPTRRLLAADAEATVGSVMVDRVVTLPASATLREATEAFLKHRLLALPVVDGGGRLAGVLDISLFSDEVIALEERSAIDDVFQVIGVHASRGRQRGPGSAFRVRFPWLLANIGGGLACAALVGRYERFLDVALVLALFMPVVLALAESVSIQSMTLTLQTLHAGAAGPVVLALADVLALLFYFWLGQRVIG